jgi:hypothetical protein
MNKLRFANKAGNEQKRDPGPLLDLAPWGGPQGWGLSDRGYAGTQRGGSVEPSWTESNLWKTFLHICILSPCTVVQHFRAHTHIPTRTQKTHTRTNTYANTHKHMHTDTLLCTHTHNAWLYRVRVIILIIFIVHCTLTNINRMGNCLLLLFYNFPYIFSITAWLWSWHAPTGWSWLV